LLFLIGVIFWTAQRTRNW